MTHHQMAQHIQQKLKYIRSYFQSLVVNYCLMYADVVELTNEVLVGNLVAIFKQECEQESSLFPVVLIQADSSTIQLNFYQNVDKYYFFSYQCCSFY